MLTKDEKQAIITAYATHEGDTGSPEVRRSDHQNQSADRASEGEPEGPSQPQRYAENGGTPQKSAELPAEEGYRKIPCHHCEAEHQKVIEA